jgi:hypothetical protein
MAMTACLQNGLPSRAVVVGLTGTQATEVLLTRHLRLRHHHHPQINPPAAVLTATRTQSLVRQRSPHTLKGAKSAWNRTVKTRESELRVRTTGLVAESSDPSRRIKTHMARAQLHTLSEHGYTLV